jgi:hypothetical protein
MARRIIAHARVYSLLVVIALMAIVLTTTAAYAQLTPGSVTITSTVYDPVAHVSSAATSSILGQSVTITVTVTAPLTPPPPPAVPTGQVFLYDNSGLQFLGFAQLNASGVATFTSSILTLGTHSISANYMGDPNYNAYSSTGVYSFTVYARPSVTTSSASANPGTVGMGDTITATVGDAATTGPGTGATGVFTAGNPGPSFNLQSLRSGHAANLLSDGTVLVSGGTVAGAAVKTVEFYNPITAAFANVSTTMKSARSGHTATLLSDGLTTLITGGDAAGDAELYVYNLASPGSASTNLTNSLTVARSGHTANQLGISNTVLIIGGSVAGSPVGTAEVFSLQTGGVELVRPVSGTLAYPRSGHTTTLLGVSGPSNNILTFLIAGGDVTGTAEIINYDELANSITQVGSATWLTARTGHTATLLPDGQSILFTGGTQSGVPAATAEIFQIPTSLTAFTSFTTIAAPSSLTIARSGHAATLLDSALVLLTGGEADTTPPTQSAELYTPAFDPQGLANFSSDDPTDIFSSGSTRTLLISGAGQSFSTSTLIPYEVGTTHNITAVYPGDIVHGDVVHDTSTASSLPLTVNKGTQSTVTVVAPSTAAYGQPGLSALASGGNGTGSYIYFATASTACSIDPNTGVITITAGTGTCTITATRNGDVNYLPSNSSFPASITVTPVAPAITWANPADIVYGTTLSGTQLNATASFTTGGVTVPVAGVFTYTPPVGTLLNAGAGQVLSVSFAPTDTTDYVLTFATATINVSKATPTVTWANPADIVFGTPLNGTQLNATLSWVVNGATVTVPGTPVYSPAATPAPPSLAVLSAGLAQPLQVTFTPTDNVNYNPATKTVVLNVLPATPTVTWVNPADIVFGTPLSATQLNAQFKWIVNSTTVTVTGTPVYTPAATPAPPSLAVLSVGNAQPLAVSFTPADATDYNPTTASASINVTKATPTITWANPADIVFGTPLNGTQLNAAFSWIVNGTTVVVPGAPVYTPAATPAPPSLAVLTAGNTQPLAVNFTPTDSADYNPATTTVHLNVLPATPTITWATPADIVFGTPLNGIQLNATFSWIVNSTTVVVPGAPVYNPAATPAAPSLAVLSGGNAQPLQVTFSPTDAVDYTVANKTVPLNVLPATPVIAWLNPSNITYGTPLSGTQLDGQFSWVVNGTTVVVPGTPAYTPVLSTELSANRNQTTTSEGQSQGLALTFTPAVAIDYTLANQTDQINIDRAPAQTFVTLTVAPTPAGLTFTVGASVYGPNVVASCPVTSLIPNSTCASPTGNATFFDGTIALGAAQPLAAPKTLLLPYANFASIASAATGSLVPPASGAAPTQHTITATYDGLDTNQNYLGSSDSSAAKLLGSSAVQPTVINFAPPVPGFVGTTVAAGTFTVPSQAWATGSASVTLSCQTFNNVGTDLSSGAIPCTLTAGGQSTSAAIPTLTVATGTSVTVTIAPTAQNAAALPGTRRSPSIFAIFGLPAFGLLLAALPGAGSFRRRRALALLGLALSVILLLGMLGCGGGFSNSQPLVNGQGVPPGTYYVVVNGSYSVSQPVYNSSTTSATTAIFVVPAEVQ